MWKTVDTGGDRKTKGVLSPGYVKEGSFATGAHDTCTHFKGMRTSKKSTGIIQKLGKQG